MWKTLGMILGGVVLAIMIALPVFFYLTPVGVEIRNDWSHSLKKADDRTNYEKLKDVENNCRGMIASYTNDVNIYNQYKDSSNPLDVAMANNAKTRANQTASTYNNYMVNNNYLWKDNIPDDIYMTLAYL